MMTRNNTVTDTVAMTHQRAHQTPLPLASPAQPGLCGTALVRGLQVGWMRTHAHAGRVWAAQVNGERMQTQKQTQTKTGRRIEESF